MRCPVCKTECAQSNVCPECGFSEVGKVFINQEEATQWITAVVAPYRDKYHQANVLPPIEWLEIFKKFPPAKQLFEFSIPVTLKRRADLNAFKDPSDRDYNEYLKDATLGHIAVISSSELVRKHFIDALIDTYFRITDYKRTVAACIEQPGDLAALLTNLSQGESLLVEVNSKMRKNLAEIFSEALATFGLEILIGKGPSAKSIHLDLPYFTTVFVADSIGSIPDTVVSTLSSVIEINPTEAELNEYQIREAALFYGIQLTKANIGVINEHISQTANKNTKSVLKFISDYLYLHTEIKQPLSETTMRDVINQLI